MLFNPRSCASHEGTGEGGIRTLGSLLGYGALAKRCFRPLSHLTKISSHGQRHLPSRQGFGMASRRVTTDASREYRQESGFSNLQFALADTAVVACSRFHRSWQLSIDEACRIEPGGEAASFLYEGETPTASPTEMISEDEARTQVLQAVWTLPSRRATLSQALDCFAAQDYFARLPL